MWKLRGMMGLGGWAKPRGTDIVFWEGSTKNINACFQILPKMSSVLPKCFYSWKHTDNGNWIQLKNKKKENTGVTLLRPGIPTPSAVTQEFWRNCQKKKTNKKIQSLSSNRKVNPLERQTAAPLWPHSWTALEYNTVGTIYTDWPLRQLRPQTESGCRVPQQSDNVLIFSQVRGGGVAVGEGEWRDREGVVDKVLVRWRRLESNRWWSVERSTLP